MTVRKRAITLIIIAIVVTGATVACASEEALTIAVLDFQDNSPLASEELQPLQRGAADVVITTLSEVRSLKIVERSRIQAVFDEIALGQSGMLDESSIQEVGKLLGAHYLVLGSFMKGFKNDIRFDCRIVETETGLTVKAEEVSGKLDDLLSLMNKLGVKIIRDLDLKLNASEKRSIDQLKNVCSQELMMDYFRALELIEEEDYRNADMLLTKVRKGCPKFKKVVAVQQEMRRSLLEKLRSK